MNQKCRDLAPRPVRIASGNQDGASGNQDGTSGNQNDNQDGETFSD